MYHTKSIAGGICNFFVIFVILYLSICYNSMQISIHILTTEKEILCCRVLRTIWGSLYGARVQLNILPTAAGLSWIRNAFRSELLKNSLFYGITFPTPGSQRSEFQRCKAGSDRMAILPSSTGFACRICCSIHECWPLTAVRNCRISFVLSVFPAPDSPLVQKTTVKE